MHKVYIKTDEQGRVLAINSGEFLPTLDGWVQIDEGYGDKYHHAQGNYLDGPLFDSHGIALYELKNGKVKKRKEKVIEADMKARPVVITESERLDKLEKFIEKICSHLGVKLDD